MSATKVSDATVSRDFDYRWQQVFALSGLVGVVLCLVAWELCFPQPPDFTMSGPQTAQFYASHQTGMLIGITLSSLGMPFLIAWFGSDMPRPDRPLPRYLPVDSDRKLAAALSESSYRLAADALLLQRACGLRIGELLDLELDCVHEIPGQGSWLKIPLGKLDTERMVPLDDQVLTVIDRITATRSPGRPMRHPRTGAPADFLFTHHGKRLSQNAVRAELNRAASAAGLGHVTTHQLRHTYATSFNAGVSLQALIAGPNCYLACFVLDCLRVWM